MANEIFQVWIRNDGLISFIIGRVQISKGCKTNPNAFFQSLFFTSLDVITHLKNIAFGKHDTHVPSKNVGAIGFLINDEIFPIEMDLNLTFHSKFIKNK